MVVAMVGLPRSNFQVCGNSVADPPGHANLDRSLLVSASWWVWADVGWGWGRRAANAERSPVMAQISVGKV